MQLNSPSELAFSYDWVSDIEAVWRDALKDLKGKENLRYLEIGVFEGRSAVWFFQNILTHPTSSMVGIDVFNLENWERCIANFGRAGILDRSSLLKGRSQDFLKKMNDGEFDLIYVDGDHRARHVFQDIALSWDVLKVGGYMILDDYLIFSGTHPVDVRPQAPIDSFLSCFFSEIDLIHKCDRQTIVRKKEVAPCEYLATQFGSLQVEWGYTGATVKVYDLDKKQNVDLTQQEEEALRALLLSKTLSQFYPKIEVVSPDILSALEAKLGRSLGAEILKP